MSYTTIPNSLWRKYTPAHPTTAALIPSPDLQPTDATKIISIRNLGIKIYSCYPFRTEKVQESTLRVQINC